MSDLVISAKGIGKRYRIGVKQEQSETFVGQVINLAKAPLTNFRRLRKMTEFESEDESVFWALRDISFEVKQGEVVGIIGRNGAGKSTLLKVLSRITEPTSGEIQIKGRVSSLLEVGTGFHPELTGKENVYMNGTILGMTRREINKKFDEIVAFSGVEKFIDTPVKFFSSGMKVRLGFSVAAHLDPEILIIDEVLAVGDFEFQKKCLNKMHDVAGSGRTVLFVSHNMSAVTSLCSKGIVLHKGSKIFDGSLETSVKTYLQIHGSRQNGETTLKGEYFKSVTLRTANGAEAKLFNMGDDIIVDVSVRGVAFGQGIHVGFFITDMFGLKIGAVSTAMKVPNVTYDGGENFRVAFRLKEMHLVENTYKIDLTLSYKTGGRLEFLEGAVEFDIIGSDIYGAGAKIDSYFGLTYFDFDAVVEND